MCLVIALKEQLTISPFKRLMTGEQQSGMNKPKGAEQSHTTQQKIIATSISIIRSKAFEQILLNFITAHILRYGFYKDEIQQLTFAKLKIGFKLLNQTTALITKSM